MRFQTVYRLELEATSCWAVVQAISIVYAVQGANDTFPAIHAPHDDLFLPEDFDESALWYQAVEFAGMTSVMMAIATIAAIHPGLR